jgi:hypothetical protein
MTPDSQRSRTVVEWLRTLDKEDHRVIGIDLMRVQFGSPIGMPFVRSLKGWSLGSPIQPRKSADRASATLLSPGNARGAPRIYQEVSKDGAR